MLKLPDALVLAKLLLPHMPPDAGEISVLVFGDKIVRSLISTGHSQDYLEIVNITSGIDIESLISLGVTEVFRLFVEGLKENEILSLIEFYRGL